MDNGQQREFIRTLVPPPMDRRHSESSLLYKQWETRQTQTKNVSSLPANNNNSNSNSYNNENNVIPDLLPPLESKNQPIKILIVDDDPTTRKVLSQLLKNLGYEATTANGGGEALELLMAQEFHLMLVDVMMPEMDGYSLIRVFKQASSRDIPSIMMSGSEDPETVAKCFQCGAEDFLPKPIKEEILRARIQKCLDYRERKRRERVYKELLNEEKRLKKELSEQKERNQEELDKFRKRVSDSLETPLQAVIETISDLMNGKYEAEQYKVALITIMKSLSSSHLYRPAFVDYIHNANMDNHVREWLVNQYSKDGDDGLSLDLTKRRKSEQVLRKTSFSSQSASNDNNNNNNNNYDDDDGERLPFNLEEYKPNITGNESMTSTNYDSFDYSIEELKKHVMYMFKQLDLFEKFNFNPIRLWNLLEVLKNKYKSNFYHNFRHAVDVTQFIYIFINSAKVSDLLSLSEKFMVMTAGLFHDVGHPGVNNNFLINTQDELALIYNDRSVLENHHASYAFTLLNDPRYNILEGVDDDFYREFRRIVINIILSTDMANHFSICSKFQARLATGPLSSDNMEDRLMLLKIIMKCSDISNASRPFNIAKKWANMCIREFLQQGDMEKDRNIPVSPLMDRDTLNFPKSQIGFADFVALPLFKHVTSAFPNLSYMYDAITYNRCQWQAIYDEAERRNQKRGNSDVPTTSDIETEEPLDIVSIPSNENLTGAISTEDRSKSSTSSGVTSEQTKSAGNIGNNTNDTNVKLSRKNMDHYQFQTYLLLLVAVTFVIASMYILFFKRYW
jgi:CheY-like chemotaxis protein